MNKPTQTLCRLMVFACLFALPGWSASLHAEKRLVPPAPGIVIPPVKMGKDRMKGWWLYTQSPKYTYDRKKAKKVQMDQSQPPRVAVSFMASILRGDKAFHKLLSPRMSADLRARYIKSSFKKIGKTTFSSFFLSAQTDWKSAKGMKRFGRLAKMGRKLFGSYSVISLVEGPTSRYDHFLYLERDRKTGKWFIKGFVSRLCGWLEAYARAKLKPATRR